MIISIDSTKDSPQDIRRAIVLLQQMLSERDGSPVVSSQVAPSMPSPSPMPMSRPMETQSAPQSSSFMPSSMSSSMMGRPAAAEQRMPMQQSSQQQSAPVNPAMAAKMNTPQQDSFSMLNILNGKNQKAAPKRF